MSAATIDQAISTVFREEAGKVTAALVRRFRDFDVAEESVQEAILKAVQAWPRDGIPDRPGAWLTLVATRQALNRLARGRVGQARLAEAATEAAAAAREPGDDRLRLIMTCCHPALSREAQVYLTLRAVAGFTSTEIARAAVSSESAVAQTLVRAKRKIAQAGIPFRIPSTEELSERLGHVLGVLYLVFNEGYLTTRGELPEQRDLAEDAAWLAELLTRLLPNEPEPLGLLALMKLHLSRARARFDAGGGLVLLADQDRALWDRRLIAAGQDLILRAAALRRPGPYQVEAAIPACHAEAVSFAATDWAQVLALYDLRMRLGPSPVVRLNRAVAVWKVFDAEAALSEVDATRSQLEGYHLFHAIRGVLLAELGRTETAHAARLRALELTANRAERGLLLDQLNGGVSL